MVFCTFAGTIIDCIKDVCSAWLEPVNTVEQDDICSMSEREGEREFFFVVITNIISGEHRI